MPNESFRVQHLPAIFEPARPILATIEKAGFEAYFVGGCVRDTILNDPIHDIDIATSAYPAEVKQLFKRTVDTGIEHGTVMILDHGTGYETTTFRMESGYQDYRRPDSVTFVRSLEEDLKRRDFTINALAMKENGAVVDLFDGQGDLKRHLIRAVGDPNERFLEDALRMMRAVRFASKLDFTIDPQTLAGIKDHAPLLAKIAVERVQVEFEKLLLGQNPARGLAGLISTDLYQYCPGLKGHRAALEKLAAANWPLQSSAGAWTVLTWTLGLNSQTVGKFLKAWKLSNQMIKAVQKSLKLLTAIAGDQVDNLALFNAGKVALDTALEVAQVLEIPVDAVQLQKEYQTLPIQDSHQLAINGKMLIESGLVKPGPTMGRLLQRLQAAVIMGTVENNLADLTSAAKKFTEEME